jgi:hypothetical protein
MILRPSTEHLLATLTWRFQRLARRRAAGHDARLWARSILNRLTSIVAFIVVLIVALSGQALSGMVDEGWKTLLQVGGMVAGIGLGTAVLVWASHEAPGDAAALDALARQGLIQRWTPSRGQRTPRWHYRHEHRLTVWLLDDAARYAADRAALMRQASRFHGRGDTQVRGEPPRL